MMAQMNRHTSLRIARDSNVLAADLPSDGVRRPSQWIWQDNALHSTALWNIPEPFAVGTQALRDIR
uniref:Uncharacterized protein n=1 Tax=Anguilla anguilla TaxID=7936 RepID=A0A0E9WZ50_ANGAN